MGFHGCGEALESAVVVDAAHVGVFGVEGEAFKDVFYARWYGGHFCRL